MSLLDNNLQTRPYHEFVGNFQDVNPNCYVTNQTSYSDNFQIQNLLQAEETEQNIPSSSPTSSGKFILNFEKYT